MRDVVFPTPLLPKTAMCFRRPAGGMVRTRPESWASRGGARGSGLFVERSLCSELPVTALNMHCPPARDFMCPLNGFCLGAIYGAGLLRVWFANCPTLRMFFHEYFGVFAHFSCIPSFRFSSRLALPALCATASLSF